WFGFSGTGTRSPRYAAGNCECMYTSGNCWPVAGWIPTIMAFPKVVNPIMRSPGRRVSPSEQVTFCCGDGQEMLADAEDQGANDRIERVGRSDRMQRFTIRMTRAIP